MATKREYGLSYLLGTGLGLVAALLGFFLLSDVVDLGLVIATLLAGVLSGTFVFVGYWMYVADIDGGTVWSVAKWSALGLSVTTSIGVALLLVDLDPLARTLFPSVLINLIAVGGAIGLLLGLVVEMHREKSDLRQLNQRNRVLNRVLRHNIRNDMHVMQWHVDRLEDRLPAEEDQSVDALRRKIQEVVDTSDAARQIDSLDADGGAAGPLDVVEVVRDRIDIVRTTHPDVDVSVDLPEEAVAAVGPSFGGMVDNLVENAIEHNDGEPAITVAVEPPGPGDRFVRLVVADDGPGIPASEVEMLRKGVESQLEHGTGLGLWLVKWFADRYDGRLHIETSPSGGTRVALDVPAAAGRAAGPIGALSL